MPDSQRSLKQCPHCSVWLRVKTDDLFESHCRRCLWRKRTVYLSLLALLFSIAAFMMAVAAIEGK